MIKKVLFTLCALCHTLAAVRLQPGTFGEHDGFTANGEVVEFNQSQVTQLQSVLINGIVSDPGIIGDSIPVPISNDTLNVLSRMFLEANSSSAAPTFNVGHAQTVLNEITPEQFLPLMHALWYLDSINEQLRSIVAGRYLEVQKQISLDNLAAQFPYIEAFFKGSPTTQQQLNKVIPLHPSRRFFPEHKTPVSSVAFSPDGTLLATGSGSGHFATRSNDHTARIWDVHTGNCLHTLSGHTNSITSIAFSPDGTVLATGSGDNTARLWDVHTGECLHTLTGHTTFVTSVAFSPDGTVLATGSDDNTARLWDVYTGNCLHTLSGHTGRISKVAFSPDGTRLVTGSHDHTARIWDVRTENCLRTLSGHTDWIGSVAFSPDGTVLATGSDDNTARLWDVHTGECLHTLTGHTDCVTSVAFSPDGTLLATGSDDNTARLWDVHTGECLHTLTRHTNSVTSVAFSPDGALLATGSHDHTARIWDVRTGNRLHTLTGHTDWVNSVAFSPDGTVLATVSDDHTTRISLVRGLTLPQQLLKLWNFFHPRGFHRGASAYLDEIFNSLPDIIKPKITAPAGDGAGPT